MARPPSKPPQAKGKEPKPSSSERGDGEVRVKQGVRPGAETYEIEYATAAPPKRGDMPTPGGDAPTAPPPLRRNTPIGGWVDERDGAERGLPRPAFGGDTTVDPYEETGRIHVGAMLAKHASEAGTPSGAPPTRRLDQTSAPFDLGLALGDTEEENDALGLIGARADSIPAGPQERNDPLAELREKYALGDFSGALAVAEQILAKDGKNADAQRYAESCRDVLRQMYAARLGALTQVPVVAVPTEQLRWLTLDHRAGFLLSHVDGVSTLEEILDISGMPPLEAMRIIYDLLQQKVIALQ